MTKIELEHISNAIINRIVEVPDDLAPRDLTAWLNGYAKFQNDILEMIDLCKYYAAGGKE